ncbi:DUF4352 domain-containing protein [Embleya sp. NPDC020630]|uniref:DUF4352 domain-containing protein n=1 Tax=Embleya sp. NPDC020630 TaxID=3363979 RepID=UPI0037941626
MKHRTTAALAVGATLLALASCNDSNSSKPAAQPPGATAPAASAPQATKGGATATPAGPPAPVPIGQPVTLLRDGGSGITMTATQTLDVATGTEPSGAAPAGSRLYAVQWRIQASGTQAISSSPAMGSTVIDDQGQQYPVLTRDITAGPAMPLSVSIAAGDSRTGWVVYAVPAAAKITKIQYSPGLGLAADTGTWTT